MPVTEEPTHNDISPAGFVNLVADLKTSEEFGDDLPDDTDWMETLDNLIVSARVIRRLQAQVQP